jgi:hypothetical protein
MTAISLWENKTDAEAYNTNTYPQVLKTMARFIEGTPKVQTSDVVTSTFQKLDLIDCDVDIWRRSPSHEGSV